jgi:hypothetical protein
MAGVRPRRRPRKRSVNFRRLRWVLTREAAFRILRPLGDPYRGAAPLRRQLAQRDTHAVSVLAGVVLALHPDRRIWPPVPS